MERLKTAARWIVFAPASALAALVAPYIVHLMEYALPLEPDGFFGSIVIEAMKGVAAGVALVYVGASVAPAHRKTVALMLSVIGLMLTGIGLFANLVIGDYPKAWQAGCFAVGICSIGAAVLNRELFNETEPARPDSRARAA